MTYVLEQEISLWYAIWIARILFVVVPHKDCSISILVNVGPYIVHTRVSKLQTAVFKKYHSFLAVASHALASKV
jgi:hypothetical protein